jgi:hypothetical protein
VRGGVARLRPETWAPQLVAIAFLILALSPANPYAFYILLRWVCCSIFSYLTFHLWTHKAFGWAWITGFTAAIYNPLLRVHLNREIWSIVNIFTIILACATVVVMRKADIARDA